MRNEEVAHLYVNQSRTSARTPNGNFSFDGVSLYSYRTEIARFSNNVSTLWYTIKKHNLDANRVIKEFRLGDYTVRELTPNYLVVGCHAIPRSELLEIAIQLGLEPKNN